MEVDADELNSSRLGRLLKYSLTHLSIFIHSYHCIWSFWTCHCRQFSICIYLNMFLFFVYLLTFINDDYCWIVSMRFFLIPLFVWTFVCLTFSFYFIFLIFFIHFVVKILLPVGVIFVIVLVCMQFVQQFGSITFTHYNLQLTIIEVEVL